MEKNNSIDEEWNKLETLVLNVANELFGENKKRKI